MSEKRYSYSTVGYGVFSLVGEVYRIGRIEVFDNQDTSGYAVHEGYYQVPHKVSQLFEDFIESLETDHPIYLEIGSSNWCDQSTSEKLNIPVDKFQDKETLKEFYKKKNDEWSMKEHGVPFDEHIKTTKFYREDNK